MKGSWKLKLMEIYGELFYEIQVIGHEITHAVLKLSETKEELISCFGKEINYLTEMIIRGVN